MAITSYIAQNIKIEIFITEEQIESTDTVSIYETTVEPSAGVLIAKNITAVPTTIDPSATDAYSFTHAKRVFAPGTYSFYYTISDEYGNESEAVSSFSIDVDLVPREPSSLTFSNLDFTGINPFSLDTDTALWYKMNDNEVASNTVIDATGSNDGTYTNVVGTSSVSVDGKINKALSFVVEDDNIATSHNFQTVFQNSFSINAWIKMDDGQPTVINTICGYTSADDLQFYVEGTSLKFYLGAVNWAQTSGLVSGQTPWHMVTAVVTETDTNNANIEFFVDSISVGDETKAYDLDGITGANLLIGSLDSTIEVFYGDMDDFRIFDKKISQEEIDFLYNGGDGTEDNTYSDYQTIYHYDDNNPSLIVNDGDFYIGATVINLNSPGNGDFEYFRTLSSILESSDSGILPISVVSSVALETPLTDPENLNLTNAADGKFYLDFNYNTTSDDPVDIFRVYYDTTINPSTEIVNPSFLPGPGPDWVLDGTINYSGSSKYRYTTTAQPDGAVVAYKVVPFATGGLERDNDNYEEGTADATAPVVATDLIITELI